MSASNEGNEGNEGNVGNRSAGRGGGGGVLPDRVDLPWVTYENMEQKRLNKRDWPDRSWDGAWFAWTLLADFAQAVKLHETAAQVDSNNLWVVEPQQKNDEDNELADLIKDAEAERADALGEIIAQHDGFIDYFLRLLYITPHSHPYTCRLLHLGSVIGAYVSMHFKRVHNLRRPSHRAPALMPQVPVPGHPSYPSGHATQAFLMAGCVIEALDAAGVQADLKQSLLHLAARIGRNREIAGLHYVDDTAKGKKLAGDALVCLKQLPRFNMLVNAAKAEWP